MSRLLPHPPISVELNPKRFLSAVLPGCSLRPFCKQTGQVSANSARYFKLHWHRAIFFYYRKSGEEDSALPLLENHNSWASYRHGCSVYTKKDPSTSSKQFLSLFRFKKHGCCYCCQCHLGSDLWKKKQIFFFFPFSTK